MRPSSESSDRLENWFWIPVWKQSPRLPDSALEPEPRTNWLIFADDLGFGSALAKLLSHSGHAVTVVRKGDQFQSRHVSSIVMNPTDPSGYVRLVNELKAAGRIPKRIAHLWTVGNDGARERSNKTRRYWIDHGLYSLLQLWHALAAAEAASDVRLDIISSNLHAVCGERFVYPEKATVLGPCRVIPQEFSGARCRSIDIDLSSRNTVRDHRLISSLASELQGTTQDEVVAFRGHERWAQHFENVTLKSSKPRHLRASGVYLVTGGLGSIGLEIAEHLANAVHAELALVTRSPFPHSSRWDEWLADHDHDDITSARIRRIRGLEEAGSKVLVLTADVADLAQMRRAVHLTERTFGRIHGVFHAAGVAGGGRIPLQTISTATETLAAKVEGTAVLETLLGSANLDFMVLCSSLSAITGAAGLVDVCAANAFLEAHAHFRRRSGQHVIAIDWNAWRGKQFLSPRSLSAEFENWRSALRENSLTPVEGVDVLTRAIISGLAQVVVSRDNPASLPRGPQSSNEAALHPCVKDVSTALSSAFITPTNEVEQTIAEIWSALLGREQVGANENFFNLGGHSLVGARALALLQSAFEVQLPIRTLFEAPTVAELAKIICERLAVSRTTTERKVFPARVQLAGEMSEV